MVTCLGKLSGTVRQSCGFPLLTCPPSGLRGLPINNICWLGSGTDVLEQNTFRDVLILCMNCCIEGGDCEYKHFFCRK